MFTKGPARNGVAKTPWRCSSNRETAYNFKIVLIARYRFIGFLVPIYRNIDTAPQIHGTTLADSFIDQNLHFHLAKIYYHVCIHLLEFAVLSFRNGGTELSDYGTALAEWLY